MPAPLQVVFLDAADTIIYLPRTVGEHYREVALTFGVAPEADALNHAFRKAWGAAPSRPATQGPRPDDDKGWWRDLVTQVFDAVLNEDERRRFDLSGYFEQVYAHFARPGVWEMFPETPGVLAGLREDGYRLGVISNFDGRLRQIMHSLDLAKFFERLVISSEVGVDKPDPRIFQYALEQFGVAPDVALHVGDDPRKDWGAEAAGLAVFRLERPRHTLQDVRAFLAGAARR